MFVHIGYRHAEAATAAVHIEYAVLKCSLTAQVVKVVEGNEVHQQAVQMAMEDNEFFHISNAAGTSRDGQILLHQPVEAGCRVAVQQLVHPRCAENFFHVFRLC